MKNLKPSIPKPKIKMPKMPRVTSVKMVRVRGFINPLRLPK